MIHVFTRKTNSRKLVPQNWLRQHRLLMHWKRFVKWFMKFDEKAVCKRYLEDWNLFYTLHSFCQHLTSFRTFDLICCQPLTTNQRFSLRLQKNLKIIWEKIQVDFYLQIIFEALSCSQTKFFPIWSSSEVQTNWKLFNLRALRVS
jgi:hypothetical protein